MLIFYQWDIEMFSYGQDDRTQRVYKEISIHLKSLFEVSSLLARIESQH